MLSYTAVSKPCSRRMRRRTAASQTGLACETGMRRPWRFHPGRKIVAPPAATQPPPWGAAMSLGAAQRSTLAGSAKWIRTTIERINSALPCRVGHRGMILKLVDPLGLEPRPDGLRDRCAAVTPRINAGKGGGSCIPIIGFGDRGSAVELRPCEAVERVARIELASSVWKTVASPFGQTRIEFWSALLDSHQGGRMDDGFTDRCNRYSAKRRKVGTSLMNRTSVVAVRSRDAGSTGRGIEGCWRPSHGIQPGLLSLTRRAPSHLARRAHSSRACSHAQAIDECQPRHRRPACAYAYLPPVASLFVAIQLLKNFGHSAIAPAAKIKKARMLARSGPLGHLMEAAPTR